MESTVSPERLIATRESAFQAVRTAFDDQAAQDARQCTAHYIIVKRLISLRSLVKLTSVENAFIASFGLTLMDITQTINFKFSPYIFFDPSRQTPDFIANLIAVSSSTFFGVAAPDLDLHSALSDYSFRTEGFFPLVSVPLSAMIASSLTVSVVFWGYILIVFMAKARNNIMSALRSISLNLDLEQYVFTSMFLTVTAILCVLYVSYWAINLFWSLILG